ncbi:cation diffusion facilitator family transporter [Capnocytophaga sputigena]|uniref:Cation transporter n=1 Tax=Capnocytophaga sputigena TaxID=1019 RepID=A0AAX2I9E0_CAPSP|nr:cation diffusion facilitator family transporter [Capnocytophaga sputigena]ATA85206.1 cation transporter [Capnocytophaga sputigena]EEB65256.1 cation diffusion facilitator family transporter [Capnocytophaga sputigena ATCC 33612]SQA74697.1 Ferrous-iron efflux pump FieF [Capnocytophaga sputigena]
MKSFRFQQIIAFVGVLLFIVKLIAWQMTHSDAVLSDAMESIVNIIAAFMGLYSLYLCNKPRDTDHPYGHGKVEFVTSGIEGALIGLAGILIIVEAVHSLITGIILNKLDWGIAIVTSTAILNYTMGYISYRKGKREHSLVLISSGKHLQSDTISTIGVVVSLVLVHLTGWLWLDPLIALLFGGYIIIAGYQIVRKALSGIMDEKDEALFTELVNILQANRKTEWIDIHNMRIQQFGAHLHIDAHITLPYYYSLKEAHQEMENVIHLLVKKVNRTIEFNFHLDYCKPFSCEICAIDCPFREKPFVQTIQWDVKNIAGIAKHKINEK